VNDELRVFDVEKPVVELGNVETDGTNKNFELSTSSAR
jgi:hypothetical protein